MEKHKDELIPIIGQQKFDEEMKCLLEIEKEEAKLGNF
jgi:hypothetical protein